jgi:predicted transcriptional regulator
MEGETILLDLSTGRYYTLNRLGSVIWEHCNGHSTISDIHAVLCDRFEVAPDRALCDLVALVNQLVQEGLLQQERRWGRMNGKKESYVQPELAKHELLRDITAAASGYQCEENRVPS